jgi:hypothetical protein
MGEGGLELCIAIQPTYVHIPNTPEFANRNRDLDRLTTPVQRLEVPNHRYGEEASAPKNILQDSEMDAMQNYLTHQLSGLSE